MRKENKRKTCTKINLVVDVRYTYFGTFRKVVKSVYTVLYIVLNLKDSHYKHIN